MQELILENGILKVHVSTTGAQLVSFFDKRIATELLWSGDPAVWPWHSPNLFPVVGQCQNDSILVGGKEYTMKRHGFARNSNFTVINSNNEHVVLSMKDTPETLLSYPFKFEFQILYDLVQATLRITYKVINHSASGIWFSIGAHPAFAVPNVNDPAYNGTYVEFGEPAPHSIYLLDTQGMFNNQTAPAPLTGNKLFIKPDLFSNDALVFKNIPRRHISLKRRNTTQSISLSFEDFPYLGIWSKPGAPFLCLEPWIGCADSNTGQVEFKNKEGIRMLENGHVFEAAYTIESTI